MDETTADLSGMTQEDRDAVFARVWKRVMEGREEVPSPLSWATEPELQGHGSLQGEEDQATTLPAPAERPWAGRARTTGDFPQGHGGFLGENCRESVPLLQEMIRRELADWRGYQALAKRVGGPQARVFQAMAKEEKGHAKALCAALFLIAGVRYWPETGQPAPALTYLGTLRRRFGEEQAGMAAYLAAAEGAEDPLLAKLFLDHARDEWEHACRIRTLVENA